MSFSDPPASQNNNFTTNISGASLMSTSSSRQSIEPGCGILLKLSFNFPPKRIRSATFYNANGMPQTIHVYQE